MTSEQPGQSGPQGVLPVPAWDAPDPSEPPGDPFGPGGWAVGNLGYAVDGLVAGATGLLVAEALDVAFTLGGWVSGNSSGRSPILAVGAAAPEPVAIDGQVQVRTVMRVTLSADHRVVDGATAAEWLKTFRTILEQPLQLFDL